MAQLLPERGLCISDGRVADQHRLHIVLPCQIEADTADPSRAKRIGGNPRYLDIHRRTGGHRGMKRGAGLGLDRDHLAPPL